MMDITTRITLRTTQTDRLALLQVDSPSTSSTQIERIRDSRTVGSTQKGNKI